MKNLNSISLYKKPNISKHKIDINPIIQGNNSLDLSDNQNNEDIFLKKILIQENKLQLNKMVKIHQIKKQSLHHIILILVQKHLDINIKVQCNFIKNG